MAATLRSPTSPEPRIRADLPVGLAIGGVTFAAWAYLIAMVWGMEHMDVSTDWLLMPQMMDWTAYDLALVFLMWTVMMAAMMLPSVLPLLLMLRRIDAAKMDGKRLGGRTFRFVAGYLTIWAMFSALATIGQWGLLELRLVSPMMDSSSAVFSGVLLLVTGAYQFSPLKYTCLQHCRSPLGFLLTQNSNNRFLVGWRHGSYCAGCCWMIMVLLFVFGVMNLLWIVVLTAIVFCEKFLPHAKWFSYATGLALVVLGGTMLVRASAGM